MSSIALVATIWLCVAVFVAWWLKGFPSRGLYGNHFWRWPRDTGLEPSRGVPYHVVVEERLKGEPGNYTGLRPLWRLVAAVMAAAPAALVLRGACALELTPWTWGELRGFAQVVSGGFGFALLILVHQLLSGMLTENRKHPSQGQRSIALFLAFLAGLTGWVFSAFLLGVLY